MQQSLYDLRCSALCASKVWAIWVDTGHESRTMISLNSARGRDEAAEESHLLAEAVVS